MSPQLIKIIIAGVLLLHGLGHGGAIGALNAIDRGVPSGKWLALKVTKVRFQPQGVGEDAANLAYTTHLGCHLHQFVLRFI